MRHTPREGTELRNSTRFDPSSRRVAPPKSTVKTESDRLRRDQDRRVNKEHRGFID